MANKKISIEGIDSKTGKLKLSDGGKTKMDSDSLFRNITWDIDKKCKEVKSFVLDSKTTDNPFKEAIPITYDDKVKLTVKKGAGPIEWDYSINWKDKEGKITPSDPIITIKPSSGGFAFFITKIVMAIFVCLGLSFMFFKKKKSKN